MRGTIGRRKRWEPLLCLFHLPILPRALSSPLSPALPTIQSDPCGGKRAHKAFVLWINRPQVSTDCRIFNVANRKKPRHFIEMPLFCHYLTTLLRFNTWLLRSKAKCFNWAENTFYFFFFLSYSRFHGLCKSWPSQSRSFTLNQGNLVCCEYTYGGRSGSWPILKSLDSKNNCKTFTSENGFHLQKKTQEKEPSKSWLKQSQVFRPKVKQRG